MTSASIAVSAAIFAIDKPYTYLVPEEMRLQPGMRVMVPFSRGNRCSEGVVLSLQQTQTADGLKTVLQQLDTEPVLSDEMLQLAAFVRERYFCTFYDAIRAMLPAGMWYQAKDTYHISNLPPDPESKLRRKPEALAVLEAIVALGGSAEHQQLRAQFEDVPLQNALRYLLNKKWLTAETDFLRKIADKTEKTVALAVSAEEAADFARRRKKAAPTQAAALELLQNVGSCGAKELCYFTGATTATLRRLEQLGYVELSSREVLRLHELPPVEPAQPFVLNCEQQLVFDGLLRQAQQEKPGVALLYGVTGSGKTAVYMKLIERCLAAGRQAIVLVPEIALTPQLLQLFVAHFGKQVAVLHSSLAVGERYDTFKRIRRGQANVVIGTRSASFAPVPRLGLMVVDEEQEHSYKSENTPRYHAREIAIVRGAREHALVLLASATPSVESMYRAKSGVYTLYCLKRRFNRQQMPPVEMVDMKQELKNGNGSAVSTTLLDALTENQRRKQQSILFLNRRGSSRMTVCVDCGFVPMCERCSIHLTYHQANGRLMCHYCGFSIPLPKRCPQCGGHLKQVGFGTQRVEETLHEMLPDVQVVRMDADTVTAANSHEKILSRFRDENIPILLGTQMVAKGLDFENVTLVGVLDADTSLYSTSYRAAETTFSLITQVVGRAGRGERPGRAVIQTMTPENQVLQLAAAQNYDDFYDLEIRLRQLRNCPPFFDLVTVNFMGIFEEDVCRGAALFREMCAGLFTQPQYRTTQLLLLGPVPAEVVRKNNRYHYRINISCHLDRPMRRALAYLLQEFGKDHRNRSVTAFADVNSYE